MRKKQPGFTIIELLVVVAIIAILTAVGLALLSNAREKSRDARRLEDIRQIQTALNLYATDHNGLFPTGDVDLTGSDSVSTTLVTENHIPTVPTEPLLDTEYHYMSATGATYTITFCLETDSVQGYSEGCSNTITP